MVEAWAWFASLGSPRCVMAPMVDQSELAYRVLCRQHGCELCYTPMLLADRVARDATYRRRYVEDDTAAEGDRPLIAQLGGANAEDLITAALALERSGRIDAIDLNLGCPQACARRAGFGAWLEADRAVDLVRRLAGALRVIPVTVKIRGLASKGDDLKVSIRDTVAFARRLQGAGAKAIAFHARTRCGKSKTAADWAAIRAVVRSVDIPVIGNGDVRCRADVDRMIAETGCAAVRLLLLLLLQTNQVMSADALLKSPRLFEAAGLDDEMTRRGRFAAAKEYLAVAAGLGSKAPPVSWARAHVVAMLDGEEAIPAAVATAADLAGLAKAILDGDGDHPDGAAATTIGARDARARGRRERHLLKASRAKEAKEDAPRQRGGDLTDRARAAVQAGALVLCARGCGQPAKKSCKQHACARCCRALGDCGHHETKKRKRDQHRGPSSVDADPSVAPADDRNRGNPSSAAAAAASSSSPPPPPPPPPPPSPSPPPPKRRESATAED